jgi:predicted N-acetyltransferase YhbS
VEGVVVRPLEEGDLDAADHVMRVAFGTLMGLPEPAAAFGEAELVRTRFRAAPDCAWAAELDGAVVGSVFAARWGRFGFFGPLSVHPSVWGEGVGSRLMGPVMDAFERWELSQAGLFTRPESAGHIGLYQKFGFWPRFLNPVTSKPVTPVAEEPATLSGVPGPEREPVLREIGALTDAVFPGLDVEREISACEAQGIGDTVLIRAGGRLAGVAVCHGGAGSEAGSDTCFVKFGAVAPGPDAGERFERLLDGCEAFASASGLGRLVAGVNAGRRDAYARLLQRGFRLGSIGLSMLLRPDGPNFDGPGHYVIDDLR